MVMNFEKSSTCLKIAHPVVMRLVSGTSAGRQVLLVWVAVNEGKGSKPIDRGVWGGKRGKNSLQSCTHNMSAMLLVIY